MNTNDNPQQNGDDERAPAVRQAEAGAVAWRAVVHAQLSAVPDHADFYAIGAELVATLHAVESLATVLVRQVEGYAAGRRRVYDDSGGVDPIERLQDAAEHLRALRNALTDDAVGFANGFWSAIGHISVEDVTS